MISLNPNVDYWYHSFENNTTKDLESMLASISVLLYERTEAKKDFESVSAKMRYERTEQTKRRNLRTG